ncbi:lipopolysaccharide biosynthesis protein [Bifidobacterium biavatii]|uniref:Multidrug transporter n=1 Tax=Bifidobacterium biavatii DSM 23969 TaxID=1437608 RepID=A0A086ZSZ8_9BIFI|nr:oligosaccharide flippase family protein [Bifidobacterium biavatii]KFI49648.1 multidrug transporter [Bifidobacterium biavatii DSM 23969]
MNKYKNLLLNVGLFLLSAISTKLITFILIPLYTTYLTNAQYGITDMAYTIISLVGPIASCSINDAVVRYVVDDERNIKRYVTLGTWITILSCLIAGVLLPLTDLPMFGGLGEYKLWFFLNFITWSFNGLFSTTMRGLNHVKLITRTSIFSGLVTGVSAFIFIGGLHFKTEGYFISIILGGGIGALQYLFAGKLYRYIGLPKLKSDRSLLWKMLMFSLPLVPNAVFWWAGNSVNRFFITSMLGIGASGLFAAASKIPNLMNMVSTIFWQAWSLSAFQEYRKSNISGFFTNVFAIFKALTAVVGSTVIMLSPWLASFLLQKKFFQAWPIIPLLVFAFCFSVLSGFYGTVFTTGMKTQYLLITTGVAAAIVVAGTWLFIPFYGLRGAAYAMILSNLVMLVMRIFEVRLFMEIKVNWAFTVPTFILLGAQAFVMSSQTKNYIMISICLWVMIAVLQILEILPSARLLLSRFSKHRHARHGKRQ